VGKDRPGSNPEKRSLREIIINSGEEEGAASPLF